ncbi:MAG TPA: DUF6531 domain-containing protein, partial [Burkholderiales bacterium]|nr:DUF6531 domain-containing protein [Burkholderiales bacterium]
MKTYRKGILSTALWILLTVTCHAQTGWTIIDLGVLPGGDVVNDISIANGINENGEVAAQSTTPGSFSVDFQASLWSAGSGMQDLGPGSALGINNSGQVVGSTNNGAFVWSAGSGMQVLGSGYAQGINDSGQIVGASAPDVGTNGARAFLWSAGSGMQDLGPGSALGINKSGQVVGESDGGQPHAFLWSSGSGMQDLGTLPGDNQSQANGINDSGQVVGYSLYFIPLSNSIFHAFLWSSGSGMRDLGALSGADSSRASGINNSGQVVGESFASSGGLRAFLWSSASGMQDLSALPEVLAAGWNQLARANAINNLGQIVGTGYLNDFTVQHAFLLSPPGVVFPPPNKAAGSCPSYGQDTGDDPNKPDPCPLGNPINPFTGNKYQIETDYVGAGVYPLRFERYYNSNAGGGSGRIGAKWRHTFDRAISASGASATVSRPDGKQFVFTQSGTVFAPSWVAPADVMDRLTQIPNEGFLQNGIWIYTTAPNDEVETYDTNGRLVSIANRAGVAHT